MPKSKVSKSAPGPGAEPQDTSATPAGDNKAPPTSAEPSCSPGPEMPAQAPHELSRPEGNGLPRLAPAPKQSAISTVTAAAGAQPAVELAEKIKDLVRLAQEQGYLTYGDINDGLPEGLISPEALDER